MFVRVCLVGLGEKDDALISEYLLPKAYHKSPVVISGLI